MKMRDPKVVDVLIVGGGISGLAVAHQLVNAGRSVRILEARPVIGGRLRTHGGLDLGATWFWPHEHRVKSLIDELDVAVFSQYLDGDAILQTEEGPTRLDGNPIDIESGRFNGGAESLARAVAERLPSDAIELEQVVTEVRAGGDHIEVHTATDRFEARHVVLALPPALAAARVSFSPSLPSRLADLAASTPVWMGAITKVVAQYARPFWRSNGLAGAAISHVGPVRELHDMSGADGTPAALFGFVPGTERKTTVEAAEVLSQLVSIFGEEAADPTTLWIQDWKEELHTSPPDAVRLEAYHLFGHELYAQPAFDGCLHWSSAETSSICPGHIEGALASAERVARTILGSDQS